MGNERGRRVVLHLGYPKTGTTYLQRKLFMQMADEFNIITPEFENVGVNIRRFMDGIERGKVDSRYFEVLFKRNQDILISLEGFLIESMRRIKSGAFHPPSFSLALKALKELVSGEDVYVVIYLREQVSLLFSLYAESKAHHFNNAKKLNSIDKYVDEVISGIDVPESPGWFYDFNRTLSLIKDFFEEGAICVRFYEDLVHEPEREVRFWRSITGFPIVRVEAHENTRNTGNGQRRSDPRNSVKAGLMALKARVAPSVKLPNWLSRAVGRFLRTFDSSEAETIILSESDKERVRAVFYGRNALDPLYTYLPSRHKSRYLLQ